MCKRAYKQDKKQRTQLLEECGHGTDDYNSTLFVRSMQEAFEIGVVREGRRTAMRCHRVSCLSKAGIRGLSTRISYVGHPLESPLYRARGFCH